MELTLVGRKKDLSQHINCVPEKDALPIKGVSEIPKDLPKSKGEAQPKAKEVEEICNQETRQMPVRKSKLVALTRMKELKVKQTRNCTGRTVRHSSMNHKYKFNRF